MECVLRYTRATNTRKSAFHFKNDIAGKEWSGKGIIEQKMAAKN
jgi:hypothetical protein